MHRVRRATDPHRSAPAHVRRRAAVDQTPRDRLGQPHPVEIRAAELARDGLSNVDIGRRLLCSARTVQAHLTHIYAKLGIASRAELAAQTTQHA